jgi:hypothetical protein
LLYKKEIPHSQEKEMLLAYWVGVLLGLVALGALGYAFGRALVVVTWDSGAKGATLDGYALIRGVVKELAPHLSRAWERKLALGCAAFTGVGAWVLSAGVLASVGLAFGVFVAVGYLTPAVQAGVKSTAKSAPRIEPFVTFERDDRGS